MSRCEEKKEEVGCGANSQGRRCTSDDAGTAMRRALLWVLILAGTRESGFSNFVFYRAVLGVSVQHVCVIFFLPSAALVVVLDVLRVIDIPVTSTSSYDRFASARYDERPSTAVTEPPSCALFITRRPQNSLRWDLCNRPSEMFSPSPCLQRARRHRSSWRLGLGPRFTIGNSSGTQFPCSTLSGKVSL
ncbi:uncharacterized protein K489DRAFT_118351 [Dissoconium aciculare CBS 342.82]|uniref:Uncharacterized protein n=1 Tax=Dissoconium aciculare CBS 342.82 TaxID=1314786 RepID=A0A6J3MFT8_9PEZI|nr:uncharacterized protein K489DRAFT_118351 [Dissoconium aciculare CBS 342.82]KAF1826524.1 hypothetical protein K489DRAFT_118351 [Dissoconium aciculare CBS 342.82]